MADELAPVAVAETAEADAGPASTGETSASGATVEADGADAATRPDGSGDAGPGRRHRLIQLTLLLLPSLVLLERAWDRRWMTDDGFINLRVVDMIFSGHGPIFNEGERVEVTTSTLWIWLLALGDLTLPLRLEWVAVVLGLVCSVAGLLWATFGAARLHRALGATGLIVPAGAAVLAVLSPIWDFSTSGLEGGLTFGWLGLVGFLLARWVASPASSRLGAWSAVVMGLGPLVRPDLAVMSAVVLVGVLAAQWSDDRWRDRLRLLGAAAALPVAYQVFRMGFYASLVPNTALAKSAGQTRWGVGWAYLRDFVQPYGLVIPLVLLLAAGLVPALRRAQAAGHRRALVALGALPLAGLLDGLYIVRVGGDYMHGRLLLPALYALLVPVAALPWPRWEGVAGGVVRPARLMTLGVAAALVWAVVCLSWLRPTESPAVDDLLFSSDARQGVVRVYGDHPVTTEDQEWDDERAELDPDWDAFVMGSPHLGRPPNLPPPVYAGWGIGIAGYVYGPDVYMLDMLGLGNPVVSRFELEVPGAVGHEKPMPRAWLAAFLSNAPLEYEHLPEPEMSAPLYESSRRTYPDDVEAVRLVLTCDDMRELVAAVRRPMTPARFLDNLLSAPAFTRLQVPPDPNAAVERFC